MNTLVLLLIIFMAIYFAVNIYIGFLARHRSQTLQDYMTGGGNVGVIITALALSAAFMSGGATVGCAGGGFKLGWAGAMWTNWPNLVGMALVVILAAKLTKGLGTKIKALTLADIIRERYNSKWCQGLTGIAWVIFLTLYLIPQYKAGGAVFTALTGLPMWVCIVITAAVVSLYVATGGFLGTTWTMALQAVLMIVGGVVTFIYMLIIAGGPIAVNVHLKALNPNFIATIYNGPPGTITSWPVNIWGATGLTLMFFTITGLPHLTSRFLGLRDTSARGIRSVALWAVFACVCVALTSSSVGPILLSMVGPKGIPNPDMALPLAAKMYMPAVWTAFYAVTLLAAIMSTAAGMTLVVASSISRDILQVLFWPNMSEQALRRLMGVVTWVILLVVLALTLYRTPPLLILILTAAMSALCSIFTVVYLIGLYWKRANKWGAGATIVVGTILCITLVALKWGSGQIMITSFLTCLVVFFGVSLLTPPQSKEELARFYG